MFKPTTELAFNVVVDEICPLPLIAIPEPADNAETTLAFVKYKFPLVSITLAVYKFNQVVEEMLPALIKLAPVNEPPEPVPVIMVFAIILPAEMLPVYVGSNAITLE